MSSAFTWDEVVVADNLVRVRIGAIEITLPCPLDEPWRELAANPGNDLTAAHPHSNWVFRGYSPGRHIDASHLRTEAQRGPRAPRRGPEGLQCLPPSRPGGRLGHSGPR